MGGADAGVVQSIAARAQEPACEGPADNEGLNSYSGIGVSYPLAEPDR
jgi:hypothetical protein